MAEDEFGPAGAGGVILQENGIAGDGGKLALQIKAAPQIHGPFGRAHFAGPVPQFKGGGDPDPGNRRAGLVVQPAFQKGDAFAEKGQNLPRAGIGIGGVGLVANRAHEIHQNEVGTASPDLQAEGIHRVGIDVHRHGWLADAPALRLAAQQQPVIFQGPHDDGHGLRRKPCQPCNFRLRNTVLTTHDREHEALVISPHAHQIGTARNRLNGDRFGYVLNGFDNAQGRSSFDRCIGMLFVFPHLLDRCKSSHAKLISQFDLFIDRPANEC